MNGNIIIGGGSVYGTVTHPDGTTYSGPVPDGGETIGVPDLMAAPNMPRITSFPAAGSTNITSTTTIGPGAYNDIFEPNKAIIFCPHMASQKRPT